MNPLHWIVGALAEMFLQRDPYRDEYAYKPEPERTCYDEYGHVVTEFSARDYIEASDRRAGTTVEGDGYKTLTKIGRNRWRAGFEEMATEKYQRPGETRAERAARNERLRREAGQ